eukprot:NODE_435_length_2255_cov_22.086582_g401_i0.p1 GENE.NODE_435_length_2255_cov_22.086582_g401_i0~~NODE_435_length_2255_cov_22.086582_g401_i0.p1  ORF type:complete len:371 (-),score=44.68 NODE_435_length_2255_cov_22.086582_g401_i0:1036-2148(-)
MTLEAVSDFDAIGVSMPLESMLPSRSSTFTDPSFSEKEASLPKGDGRGRIAAFDVYMNRPAMSFSGLSNAHRSGSWSESEEGPMFESTPIPEDSTASESLLSYELQRAGLCFLLPLLESTTLSAIASALLGFVRPYDRVHMIQFGTQSTPSELAILSSPLDSISTSVHVDLGRATAQAAMHHAKLTEADVVVLDATRQSSRWLPGDRSTSALQHAHSEMAFLLLHSAPSQRGRSWMLCLRTRDGSQAAKLLSRVAHPEDFVHVFICISMPKMQSSDATFFKKSEAEALQVAHASESYLQRRHIYRTSRYVVFSQERPASKALECAAKHRIDIPVCGHTPRGMLRGLLHREPFHLTLLRSNRFPAILVATL